MKCGNWFVTALLLLSCFVAVPSLQAQNMTEEEAEEQTRCEHVVMRPQGYGTAVALLPTVTFSRAGPRADATKIKLFIKAGFGTLAGRHRAAPDWHFDDDVETESDHYGSIAHRVINIHERRSGCVNQAMVAACESFMETE